jgi:LacI family transcriptional regulator
VARGASDLLGLLVHDISDPYFSIIASGVMRYAEKHGLFVLMASTWRSAENEIEYVSMLRGHRARAVVVVGSRFSSTSETARLRRELAAVQAAGGRVACVGQNRLGVPTVAPDNRRGAADLARTLYDLGHRRFAILAGPRHLLTARDRTAGFLAGLSDRGLPADAVEVVHDEFTRDGGYTAATALVSAGTPATCVFAVNDVMATGALAAFLARGVAVPGDVSVAGFDDIPMVRDLVPSLSTVALPLTEMGRLAAEMALAPEGTEGSQVRRVRGEVILRDSTRRWP